MSSWQNAIEWANQTSTFVVLSRAFDTPYKYVFQEPVMGWWRVVDGCPDNLKTCPNKFVSKSDMPTEAD